MEKGKGKDQRLISECETEEKEEEKKKPGCSGTREGDGGG